MNGATCINSPGDYECICVNGWTDKNCDVNIDDCAAPNACLNGGTCHDRVGYYNCECPPGKTGAYGVRVCVSRCVCDVIGRN